MISKSYSTSTILRRSTRTLYNATTAQSFSDEDFAVKRSKQPRPTLLPHHVPSRSHHILLLSGSYLTITDCKSATSRFLLPTVA